MNRRVLMLAYHFPPLAGGSGQHRTLAFASHLCRYGWQPIVLTVHPRAHEYVDTESMPTPDAYPVYRAFALDSSRHLALAGRYPHWLAQPDRWISWWLGAVPAGLRLIRQYRPQLIWSTFPIATAHLVALSLQRLSGLPWVADQRDPMYERGYPSDPIRHRLHRWIEQAVARRSSSIVCTSHGTQGQLRTRYLNRHPDDFVLIPNGYDEEDFAAIPCDQIARQHQRPFVLLHSGVIYPSERNPAGLFAALAAMQANGEIAPQSFRLRLRASEHGDMLQKMLARHPGLDRLIELAPLLSHKEAIAEMCQVDGLLLLQAANCNGQIPAKLYEYLRSGKPVLALTDKHGDTARLLRSAGMDTMASLGDAGAIATALRRFLAQLRKQTAARPSKAFVAQFSRIEGSRQLASLFDSICRGRS